MRTLLLALALLMAAPALAVEPSEKLKDPALESRAREVSKDLRCLVCQNQSIDDSNAELARDLRVLVRERITAGDSNKEVLDYVVSRYGDFVLLNPPFKTSTLVLWVGPAVILVIGVVAVFFFYRRKTGETAPATPVPLSDEEKKRLDALMKESDK